MKLSAALFDELTHPVTSGQKTKTPLISTARQVSKRGIWPFDYPKARLFFLFFSFAPFAPFVPRAHGEAISRFAAVRQNRVLSDAKFAMLIANFSMLRFCFSLKAECGPQQPFNGGMIITF